MLTARSCRGGPLEVAALRCGRGQRWVAACQRAAPTMATEDNGQAGEQARRRRVTSAGAEGIEGDEGKQPGWGMRYAYCVRKLAGITGRLTRACPLSGPLHCNKELCWQRPHPHAALGAQLSSGHRGYKAHSRSHTACVSQRTRQRRAETTVCGCHPSLSLPPLPPLSEDRRLLDGPCKSPTSSWPVHTRVSQLPRGSATCQTCLSLPSLPLPSCREEQTLSRARHSSSFHRGRVRRSIITMAANYWESTQRRYWQFTKDELAQLRENLEEEEQSLVHMFPLPQWRHLSIYFNQRVFPANLPERLASSTADLSSPLSRAPSPC